MLFRSVTGSGLNIHEGVTTLIAELIRVGLVDAVSTSSAIVSHEMGGALNRVWRVDAAALGMDMEKMPRGDLFEFTRMGDAEWAALRREMPLDDELLERGLNCTLLETLLLSILNHDCAVASAASRMTIAAHGRP